MVGTYAWVPYPTSCLRTAREYLYLPLLYLVLLGSYLPNDG